MVKAQMIGMLVPKAGRFRYTPPPNPICSYFQAWLRAEELTDIIYTIRGRFGCGIYGIQFVHQEERKKPNEFIQFIDSFDVMDWMFFACMVSIAISGVSTFVGALTQSAGAMVLGAVFLVVAVLIIIAAFVYTLIE